MCITCQQVMSMSCPAPRFGARGLNLCLVERVRSCHRVPLAVFPGRISRHVILLVNKMLTAQRLGPRDMEECLQSCF